MFTRTRVYGGGGSSCGLADFLVHTHTDSCYENGSLVCPLPQILAHTHSDACYATTETGTVLVCQEPEIILHTHQPWESEENPGCYQRQVLQTETETEETFTLVCGLPQVTEHIHDDTCIATGEERLLTCTIPEHTHDDACAAAASQAQIDGVIAAIGALPTGETLDEELAALGDDETAIAEWYARRSGEFREVLAAYEALTEEQQAQVTNRDTLLALREMWESGGSQTLMISGKTVTYQIKDGSTWKTIGTSAYKTGTVNGQTRAYIDAATAESFFGLYGYQAADGADGLEYGYNDLYEIYFVYRDDTTYTKTEYCIDIPNGTVKENAILRLWTANHSDAQRFRIWELDGNSVITPLGNNSLFLHLCNDSTANHTNIDLSTNSGITSQWVITTDQTGNSTFRSANTANCLIDVPDGAYATNPNLQAYNGGTQVTWKLVPCDDVKTPATEELEADGTCKIGLTEESNGSIILRYTPAWMSGALETIAGANTRDFIEVNLYNYNDKINTLWNQDKKYPGFQQDNGTNEVADLGLYSFNFGNNITADLAAGNSEVTNKGGLINKTVNKANTPISGAMKTTLGADGYPALADGTSLKYLFSNSDYSKKQNTQSINGLFLYNDVTGAYTFNSRNNHAQFNSNDDTFTLYRQVISSNFLMYPFGNFLPFNDITKATQASTINRQTFLDTINRANDKGGDMYTTLATALTGFDSCMEEQYKTGWTGVDAINAYFTKANIPKTFTAQDLANVYSINYDDPTDFFFGMEMKMRFMQPKDGLTGKDGQQPMVFYFTGDDDVWVYLDGVLFLDLSGIHRHVGGEIDFVNGLVKYYSLDVSTGDVSDVPYETVTFAEILGTNTGLNDKGTFEDYSTHTLNFYYMERGAGSGVCRMNFNFPLMRQNMIAVTKELSVDDGDVAEILGKKNFKFQILQDDKENLFITPGTKYDILNFDKEVIGTGEVDANGIFTLKPGQVARFTDIPENAGKYIVRELLDPAEFDQYGTIQVNGTSVTSDHDVTVGSQAFKGLDSPITDVSDGSTVFRFNNQVTTSKLGSLAITKVLESASDSLASGSFTFHVTLDGTDLPVGTAYTVDGIAKTVTEAGIISLAPGQTATISRILVGTEFTVTEESAPGYVVSYYVDDQPQTTQATGTIALGTTAYAKIVNRPKSISLEIPLKKTLMAPDGEAHTYTFRLEEVTDRTGTTPVDPSFRQEISLTVNPDQAAGAFHLEYAELSFAALPVTKYYTITEVIPETGDLQTIYDQRVYVVQVTLTKGDTGLQASVTYLQDGQSCDGIRFTNWIARYELPNTGGSGTHLYTAVGLVLMISALVSLLYSQICQERRKDPSS